MSLKYTVQRLQENLKPTYLLSCILGTAPPDSDVLAGVHSELKRLVEVHRVGRDGDAQLHRGHNATPRHCPVALKSSIAENFSFAICVLFLTFVSKA